MLSSMELYNKIDDLRIKKGLTINKLSELAGISHGTLNSWKNRGTMPKLDVIEGICYALNISPLSLLYGDDFENLSSEEFELVLRWRKLNAEQKEVIQNITKIFCED